MTKIIHTILPIFWIGLCALAMLEQTVLLIGPASPSWWLKGFVLGGAVFAYTFQYSDVWRRALAVCMGGMAFWCFLKIPETARWVALAPLSVWLLYYGFQRPGSAGLRAMPVLKPLSIALAWAWVTVLLPLEPRLWTSALLLLTGRTAFVFALALAYDLTDPDFDRRQGLPTLALHLGVRRSFRLIDAALLISGFCVGANYVLGIYPLWAALALWLSLVSTAVLLRLILRRGTVIGKKLLIDGLMILQYLLVWCAAQYWG